MVIFSCDYESQLRKEVYHGKYCPAAERNYALRQNDFRLRRGARRFKENHEKKDSEYRAIQGKWNWEADRASFAFKATVWSDIFLRCFVIKNHKTGIDIFLHFQAAKIDENCKIPILEIFENPYNINSF